MSAGDSSAACRPRSFGRMIRQKRTPGLGRRGPTTHHVVPDRGFGDRDTESQQLAVDARGAPGRVGVAHLADEQLNGARNAWPTGSARPTLPAPIAPKPSSMPPENGVGLDDDERSPPSGPQVTEPRPEQPVNGPQPRAPADYVHWALLRISRRPASITGHADRLSRTVHRVGLRPAEPGGAPD